MNNRKYNILIIHAHTANRGDEAAIKAMVDELLLIYPKAKITISTTGVTLYPNMPEQVKFINRFPKVRARVEQIEFFLAIPTNGHFIFTRAGKEFKEAVYKADIVIHAPGGPAIGDIYYSVENLYLWCLDYVRKMKKTYMFYAPSMGPFCRKGHNKLRKRVLNNATTILVRDPISYKYISEFLPNKKIEQALDSALQHDIDIEENDEIFKRYKTLNSFMEKHPRCIGITITDLKWHPTYRNSEIINNLPKIFNEFVDEKMDEGFGVIFIPQLYGTNNDFNIMNEYMKSDHTFIIEDNNPQIDAYFQQYLIGKLYAVVGMRYHSNIFSAKMGTPFVSISYEQKMSGFMKLVGLNQFCIKIEDLSKEILNNTFSKLVNGYDEYKHTLLEKHTWMKDQSYKSTQAVIEILSKLEGK